MRTEAQIRAEKKFDLKRQNMARFPGSRLSKKEEALMNRLYKKFDTKKEAILSAVKAYLE